MGFPRRLRNGRLALAGVLLILVGAYVIYFPGRQSSMAFSLATGIGIPGIQSRVKELQTKAIRRQSFSEDDKGFLRDLYTCMAKGASPDPPKRD